MQRGMIDLGRMGANMTRLSLWLESLGCLFFRVEDIEYPVHADELKEGADRFRKPT